LTGAEIGLKLKLKKMSKEKFLLSGIKNMLSRDEMKKIKAGSGCSHLGANCFGSFNCNDTNCQCDIAWVGGEAVWASCANF
jgi:hypothetical protein